MIFDLKEKINIGFAKIVPHRSVRPAKENQNPEFGL